MRFLIILPVALLAAQTGHAAEGAHAIAEKFCAAQVAGDEAAVRALFSPELERVVAEAERRNAAVAAAAPDEKPPLGDGIPYQGFPDRAPECRVGAERTKGGAVEVEIGYDFPAQPNSGWTDRLVIRPAPDGLAIDDILFASFPTDTYQSGLRRVLFDSFDI